MVAMNASNVKTQLSSLVNLIVGREEIKAGAELVEKHPELHTIVVNQFNQLLVLAPATCRSQCWL